MGDDQILLEPERGHADWYHFSFTSRDGKLTGRVSIALEGRPDNRTREEKMRAARIKVEYLAHAFYAATTESRYAHQP
jgi:hypothetical protein